MREILFRGKDTETGKWRYSMTIARQAYDDNEIFSYYIGAGNSTIVGKTLGQYTGLTDKNGTKIFEGDIVEIEEHGYIPTKYKGFVVLKNGCFGVEYNYRVIFYEKSLFHRFGHIEHWQEMGASGTITYSYEVIGNIHDNPELFSK